MVLEIENFLSKEECNRFINEINNKTSKDKINFTNISDATTDKYIDSELALFFYNRYINRTTEDTRIADIIRPNYLIMTSMYKPNTKFGIHTDIGLYYNNVP